MIAIVVLVVFIVYAGLVTRLTGGWRFALTKSFAGSAGAVSDQAPLVSVLVAARDEERCLPLLLKDLRAQQYLNFEVIIVDDHSQDRTSDIGRRATEEDPRFHYVVASGEGKKAALSQAVGIAQGSWIVTTDADCRVKPNWLEAITRLLVDDSVMLCFGPVGMSGPNFFDCMQSMEFATLVGSGAAAAAWGKPIMCNGANLAYRKTAFVTVEGYSGNEQIPSGDDEFLMHKIDGHFPGSVRYCADANARVTTATSPTINAFFEQRVRWAGKWRSNTSTTARVLAIGVFGFHVCVLSLPFLLAAGAIKPSVVLLCLCLKVLSELYYISSLQSIIVPPWRWSAFFALQVVYSCYVVFVAIGCQFSSVEWKGRRLKPLMASGH